jgi:hypothetical protein
MVGPRRSQLLPADRWPASCKGHDHQGPGMDNVVHRTPKGRTFEKRHWAQQKCNNGWRNRGLKQQLHLGSKVTFYEALGQTIGLDWEMHHWFFCKDSKNECKEWRSVVEEPVTAQGKEEATSSDYNRSANKSHHPIQNLLLLVTEPWTHDSIYLKSTNNWDVMPCSLVELSPDFLASHPR